MPFYLILTHCSLGQNADGKSHSLLMTAAGQEISRLTQLPLLYLYSLLFFGQNADGKSHSLLMTAAGQEISRLKEVNQQLLEETQGAFVIN